MYPNLACVNREVKLTHLSSITANGDRHGIIVFLTSSHNQVCAPLSSSYGRPCFSTLPCSCSIPPPPIQEKQVEEKQTKKNYRGKSERAQAHYAAAVSSPRRGAFRVSTPPSSARRRTGVSSTGGSVRRRLLLPARARTEMPFRLLKAPPERRRQRS